MINNQPLRRELRAVSLEYVRDAGNENPVSKMTSQLTTV